MNDEIEEWKVYRDLFRLRDIKKKGGTTAITIMFVVLLFMVIWSLFLGGFINWNSANAINSHGLGGFEAFLWANLNLIIFVFLIIFIIAFKYIVVG